VGSATVGSTVAGGGVAVALGATVGSGELVGTGGTVGTVSGAVVATGVASAATDDPSLPAQADPTTARATTAAATPILTRDFGDRNGTKGEYYPILRLVDRRAQSATPATSNRRIGHLMRICAASPRQL